MPYKRGKLELSEILDDDLAILAVFEDSEAMDELWTRMIPLVERVTRLFVNRYPWIDHNDLTQSVLVEFPKIIKRFNPNHESGNPIRKYLYHSFWRASQDALRKEDPLGIQIPQKMPYPEWLHLSNYSEHSELIEAVTLEGYERIDSGHPATLPAQNRSH